MKEAYSYQQTARLFHLLSHPARLRTVDELRRGEACVCRLQAILQQRQPYVSQQLRVLREAGVAESRRDGLFIYYRLTSPQLLRLLEAVLGPAGEATHPTECACLSCR